MKKATTRSAGDSPNTDKTAKPALLPLFSSPVMICARHYDFSEDEERFIAELEMADNIGNHMSKNNYVLECEELSALKEFIGSQLALYSRELLKFSSESEVYITQSWINETIPGQFHSRHRHPNSMVSGVIYISGNEDRKQSALRFHRSVEMFPLQPQFESLNEFNATASTITPSRGRLVLFPSMLEHDVPENTTDDKRVSLSFNTFIRGPLGGEEQLTHVEI